MPKRSFDKLRNLRVTPHFIAHPAGSVLIECGDTKVICTATIDDKVPPWFQKGSGKGWVTAEYDMLPGSTSTRNQRDARRGKVNGRTEEISRLIGRALRAVVDMTAFGERTITVDCDVIQADGGTRTAAITGGYIALALAIKNLQARNLAKPHALRTQVAAISAGIIEGKAYLDLDYSMDSNAHVDMNFVMTKEGELVEVQGTGEGGAFKREELNQLLDLAFIALPTLMDIQQRAIETPLQNPLLVVQA